MFGTKSFMEKPQYSKNPRREYCSTNVEVLEYTRGGTAVLARRYWLLNTLSWKGLCVKEANN